VDLGPGVNTEGGKIVLPEIFGLIITNDQHHVGVPCMQALPQDRERLHDPLLVYNVLTEPIILSEFFQELRWWLIIGHAGKDALPAFGPRLWGCQDDGTMRATKP